MKYPEPESSTLQFEKEIPKMDQIIKIMIGFSNQNGGKLVIGVTSQRHIEGLDSTLSEEELKSICNLISESTTPPINAKIFSKSYGEKMVLEIQVPEGTNKPYYRTSEGEEKGTYVHRGQKLVRATPEIIKELLWQSKGLSFETMPQYLSSEYDLDLIKFEKFLKKAKNGSKLGLKKILQSYHLMDLEQSTYYPTTAGILLFGNDPQKFLSEAKIVCSHFRGIAGRETLASFDSEGDLFNQFQEAEHFILTRLSISYKIKSARRTEVLEIPQLAIREALLNAILHRDYHLPLSIKVAIFENRIEIYSPGKFPGPIDPKNLKATTTFLRNPTLCKVFQEAGYFEKDKSGLSTIFDFYNQQNVLKPELIEGENFVKCILPRIDLST